MIRNKFSKILSLILMVSVLALVALSFSLMQKVNAGGTTYETPDYISVGDLKQNGKSAGNKVIMDAHKTFTYDKTAEYGSVVFSFTYKNTTWNEDSDGAQFHLYNTWQSNGMFWLRPDRVRISYHDDGGNIHYIVGSKISAGTHSVEFGRLAVMDGDVYTGDQYYYIKVDNVLQGEVTISGLDSPLYKSNGIFTTGTNGNAIVDSNWEGSRVTFISNGTVIDEYNTTEDYISKPATDPHVEGKTFVGWFNEMGVEWDFENNQVTDTLVLRAGFKGTETISDEEYFDDSTYTPVLRFMVASDVHIGTSESIRDTNLKNAILKSYQIANANSKYKGLDAALFAGDIADGGDVRELSTFNSIARSNLQDSTQLIVSMGNHDFRGTSINESISQFANLFGAVDKHLVINGYHFISLSPDLSEGEHFSEEKVDWLDEQLAIAAKEDPTKPIFVMQHEHIQGTVYGSDAWYVNELTDVLCKYPQVVDFSGHSHHPLGDPRSIWQGTFTALGTGTLHYHETGINGLKVSGAFPKDRNGAWDTRPSAGSSVAEFQIVEIDANNAIRVIAYSLSGNQEITRYYIRNAMDEIKFTYSHTERAKNSEAPEFSNDNTLELSSVKATITLKFKQAVCKDVVESYRAYVYKGKELVKTEYILSDTFYRPIPETIEYTILGLSSDTEYKVELYAVNTWGDVSPIPLTGTIRTQVVHYDEERYEPYDLINVLDIDYPDNTGILEGIPSESKLYNYPGTAENHTAVFQYYLITGDLDSKDEFRTQVGTNWIYNICFWIQTGKYDVVFCGWIYSSSGADRIKFNVEPNHIYKVCYGTVMVETGEHEGEGYVFLDIDDVRLRGFYIPASEFKSDKYNVTMHITDHYKIADINLARTVEYYVDDNKVQEDFAISGLNIVEPTAPTKPGLFFVGWYTDPVGGERVDFTKPFKSDEKIAKYYARFTDTTFDANFYDQDGKLIETQVVGKDCKVVKPSDPIKTGEYKYNFVKWVIKGTEEEFDFDTRLNANIELEAVFEEYRYKIVYLVDGIEQITRYYVESNPSEIIGLEPEVPSLFGAEGHWEYSDMRTNKDIYARAKYDGIETTPSREISLSKFDGKTVDIVDDLVRFYLSFADTDDQAAWIDQYPVSGGHERQNISFSWEDSSRNMAYLVYFADNPEFENAFIVRTEERSIDYVGIFIPGETYYWKVVGLTNENSSEVDTFTILDTPVRWISSGTVYNVRDIGGWTTIDGKKINYGLIYRGGQLSIDQSGEVSYMDDYAFKVFDYLGLKTEIELRGDKPHELNQFNEFENLINVSGSNYLGLFSLSEKVKQHYRDVFAQLADINNYPFYFHCSWGADRTGSLAFLINGVLGVPFEQLVEDYELTSFSNSGTRTRYGWSGGAFMAMYQAFLTNYSYGGTLQDGVTNYLLQYIGVKEEHINSLKSIMLKDAEGTLTTHTVTYIIDGEVYQRSKVFDGSTVKEVVPVYVERHLDCWLLNGEPFDVTSIVTSDLVLEARFKETQYEDYDIVTLRDLGLGERFVPTAGLRSFEGTSTTGGRLFIFDYDITATDGTFDDGVHVEVGLNTWDCRAHIWFCDLTSIHIFVEGIAADGTMHPIATYNRHLEYGKTYRISVGVLIPIDGNYAGKKMFVVTLNDELLSFISTTADISSNYNIGLAGTEGIMRSVENKKKVVFVDSEGNEIETKEITRGQLVSSIENEEIENKVFLGWFDELGNIWNFDSNKVLKDMSLFAKYGDRTIDAMVIDENEFEIQHGYKVKIGLQVGEIELPLVPSESLEFDGWYNGKTKLSNADIVTEEMDLICIFKVVEKEPEKPDEPDKPDNPDQPVTPEKGCNSSIYPSIYLLAIFVLVIAIILTKKRYERE